MENGNEPDNIKKAYRTAYLVAGFLKESLTEPEKQELDAWINESEHNRKLFAELTDKENLREKLKIYNEAEADTEQYLQQSKKDLNFNNRGKITRLWAYGVAASIIAFAIIIWVAKPFNEKQSPVVRTETDTIATPGKLPEKEQVVLDMGNGKKVVLSGASTDSVISNGLLVKKGNELVYENAYDENGFHTLTVPRKHFYQLRLPDGTKVYLNASSSIRFPTRFPKEERRVYMTGEAYFEVAPNTAQPFRVETVIENRGPLVVEAVGTAFNINAYADEPSPSATLVEGKVNVSFSEKEKAQLIPNQQARVTGKGLKVETRDVGAVIAWTRNEFKFEGTPFDEALRQLTRWYDVEFISEYMPNESLHISFSRDLPIEYIVNVLSKTNTFTYRTEGRRIIITK